jgi:hypothetical protein
MRKRLIPRKKLRQEFFLIYELEGCQKAVNFLTRYYGIKRMKIVLNGRRAGNGNYACYENNKAYFTKKGLNKRIVLDEFYHHLVFVKGLDMPISMEEEQARKYARMFLKL